MKVLTILLYSFLLAGCAGAMLPGKMFTLNDGVEMEFEIQTGYGTGSMTAYNPMTRERFVGQYTSILQGGGYTQGTVYNPGSQNTSTVTIFSPPSGENARGILKGDKGTIIDISLVIQPGLRPIGYGEGVDNNNTRYQVQF